MSAPVMRRFYNSNRIRKVTVNVIVIVTDSLRVDHLGCYGSPVKTPNLDRLAEGIGLI